MNHTRSRLLALAVSAALCLPLAAQEAPQVSIPDPAAMAAVGGAGATHTLNLKAADIGVLIETVSQITGKSFIVDPRVEGRVTVISTSPQTAAEIYETFLSVLRVHGYAAVSAGEMIKIVPDAIAMQDGSVGNGGGGPDALVTRVVELQHVSAADMAQLLRPLAPQQATLSPHASSNSILITDRAGNVERLVALIRRIDTGTDAAVEVIALRHASAAEVARTLASLEGTGAAAGGAAPTKLVADDRTNSILLSGDPGQRLRLRSLIAHLDTPLDGGENTQVLYVRYAKATDLVPILDSVAATLTGVAPPAEGQAGGAKVATIQAHEETNALVVTSSPAVFRELAAVVRQLDVRRAQVLVEAVIAEVTDDLADELGVQWQTTNVDGPNDEGIIGGTNFPNSSGAGSIVGGLTNPLGAVAGGGLNLGYFGGSISLPIGPDGQDVTIFQIGALVRALRGDGRANVLSNPSVVTLDHTEAEFKVVNEVPFLTGQYTNTSTNGGANQPTNPFQTVERKDVGLILTVTPHINEGDSVRLDLRQEISNLAPGVSGAIDLITSKRELTTSVLVPDGGMLVLGGLASEEAIQNVQGVPGISRIPLLGNLFKSRRATKNKRNLMIFLRPVILRDAATEAAVSNEKYNFLRAEQLKMRSNRELKFREQQPVLPDLPARKSDALIPSERQEAPPAPDLQNNPPPTGMDAQVPRAQDAQERPTGMDAQVPRAQDAQERSREGADATPAQQRPARRIPGKPAPRVARAEREPTRD
jgi:general secretion pathway protein D